MVFAGRRLPIVLLLTAGFWAYHNSFTGTFLYDDIPRIIENFHIRHLWPPWAVLSNIRPILNLSLAFNYAISDLNTWSYHLVNFLIHLANALLLFEILRATFHTTPLRKRYAPIADPLAFSISLLWILHPIHTQAVTFISQRSESLMAFFYLFTLFAAIHAAWKTNPKIWTSLSILSCFLGMGCKPVMVTAPLMIFLYDWVFLKPDFPQLFYKRRALYVGLSLSWIPVLISLYYLPDPAAGFQLNIPSTLHYATAQPEILLHYLRLAFWPHPLVFDYLPWPTPHSFQQIVLPSLILLPLAIAGFFCALRRRHPLGFLGCWFFLILLPTSSFISIAEPIVEYRMYLPLAAVLTGALLGCWELVRCQPIPDAFKRTLAILAVFILSITYGRLTIRRNADYQNPITLWSDTVAKRPTNPRAHNNLGQSLSEQGRFVEGMAHFKEAIRLKPDYANAYQNAGAVLFLEGKRTEAIAYFRESLKYQPSSEKGHNHLGIALAQQGQLNEALEEFKEAIRCNPDYAESYKNLSLALAHNGKFSEATVWYMKALEHIPEDADLHNDLGALLMLQGQPNEAIVHFREALRFQPTMAKAHNNLGLAFAQQGKTHQAVEHFLEALKINPDNAEARSNLELIRTGGQFPQAVGFSSSGHPEDKNAFDPSTGKTH